MTAEKEYKMLKDIRDMMAMDKSKIAETYLVELDNANDYAKSRAIAVLDVVLDDLVYELEVRKNNEHYKGVTGSSQNV